MIPVARQVEYQAFDREVRRPGREFLRKNPGARGGELKNFWSKSKKHLYKAYRGRCAYTSRYMVDADSIDHFLPKSKYPKLAYEWKNYRLARTKINSYKGERIGVVDPFYVQRGWFVLDLPSCLVRPGREIDQFIKKKVKDTIDALRLNSDDGLVQERCDLLMEYASEDVSIRHLDKHYPFLAEEVRRQGLNAKALRQVLRTLMGGN